MKMFIIYHWSYNCGEYNNWSCMPMCMFLRTHISVTACENFLIWGMIMGISSYLIFFSDDHDDPTIYSIAVMNMVLSKYLFDIYLYMYTSIVFGSENGVLPIPPF